MNDHDEAEAQKTSVLHRIGSFFSLREDEEEIYDDEPETPRRNVVAFSRETRRSGPEVALFAPRAFADVTDIADALRSRRVAIVNLQGVDRALLQRIVDFTSGVAYTLDGKIQKLADAMYLVVPPGVAVNSQGLRDSLGGDSLLDFMTNRGEGR
jgi:cell division inhibitor SepF